MELVDNVPVINLRNCITVSLVPLNVVAEGLIRLLDDAAQIPSGFGTLDRMPGSTGRRHCRDLASC